MAQEAREAGKGREGRWGRATVVGKITTNREPQRQGTRKVN